MLILVKNPAKMIGKLPDKNQMTLYSPPLETMLNPNEKLYQLALCIDWTYFEKELTVYYCEDNGAPSKPIRLMVSLLLLKQIFNLSDESVIEQWRYNPYYQFFSGYNSFQWNDPADFSDIHYFRKRIGESGVEKILQYSISLHGKSAHEKEIVGDTTVQEKNITYPTDVKQYRKIINKCNKIAKQEGIAQRQSYTYTVRELLQKQKFRNHPKNYKTAIKAEKKLKTIAGRVTRELERKLPANKKEPYKELLQVFNKILTQQKEGKNKIYSIHEPAVYCISKGKAHKKYEYGSKASIFYTKTTGVIVGALNIKENDYDGHTLPAAIEQTKRLTGKSPKAVIVDRGYKGRLQINDTQVISPKPLKKTATKYQKYKQRKRFRRRAAIEPVIGHLKSDYRMARNYLKGQIGDSINLMLAAAAYNFRKYMNQLGDTIFVLIKRLVSYLENQFIPGFLEMNF